MKNNKLLRFVLASLVNLAFTASLLLVAYVVMQVFFITSFKIPTPSMDPVIKPGDYVWVNKLVPGPRIFTSWDVFNKNKADVYRIKGIGAIRRNDIVVFNFPYPQGWDEIKFSVSNYYAKRCVALPGDTFRIRNGYYLVNSPGTAVGCLWREKQLSETPDANIISWMLPALNGWTIKNFGPLYLPRQGDVIALDTNNIGAYRTAIEYETERKIAVRSGMVLLDNVPLPRYTFRESYYFMAGDLLLDSKDSRYWGILPEKFIVGRVGGVWWSVNPHSHRVQWERIFARLYEKDND